MKHRIKQRGLSLLLAVIMVITAVPLSPLGEVTSSAAAENLGKAGTRVIREDTTLKDVKITGGTGQSAVVIEGNVTLTIEGTVRLTGGKADYNVGAGAGIEVPAGSSLTLKGSGTLYATGGSAANGENADKNNNAVAGRGGGGAGAGIGGKGASNAQSTSSAGSITIADKNLLVEANGGAGSSTGGAGSSGGRYVTVEETFHLGFPVYVKELTLRGGSGGAGGGGGGFPAAGIGSGGASGGNGGAGGSIGTRVKTSTTTMWFSVYYGYVAKGLFLAAGGGGAGGGGGYYSGGGGGTGQTAYGQYYSDPYSYGGGQCEPYPHIPFESDNSATAGGAAGQDGVQAKVPAEYDGEPMRGAIPGKAGGKEKGGTGGAGGSVYKKGLWASSGGNGEDAGKKMNGGTVTLKAGSLVANSGGGNAQKIGCGDGAGSASSGSFVIKGGTVKDYGNQASVPTDGSSKVYPVTVIPANSSVAIQEVLVNGSDFGVRRYLPDANGQLILWLPNGTYTAEVITEDGASTLYESFAVKNEGLSPTASLSDPVRLDVGKGDIRFYKNRYEQNSVSGAYSGEAVLYDATSSGAKPNVAYENLNKDAYHQTVLQNVSLNTVSVIGEDDPGNTENLVDTNDKYAKINLIPEGTGNRIENIRMVDDKTDVSFGGDADSELTVGNIGMEKENIHYDYKTILDYNYISELKLGISDDSAAEAKGYLWDKGYTVIEVDLNRNAGGRWIYLGYKTTKNPDEAISQIVIVEEGTITLGYDRVEDVNGEDPDLNLGAGGDDLYMYVDDKISYEPNGKKRITKIDFFTYEDDGESNAKSAFNKHLSTLCNNKCCYPDRKNMCLIVGGALADLNEDAGGDYIYGYFNLVDPETPYQDHASISKDDKHSGNVFMNGSGKVTVESVKTTGVENIENAEDIYNASSPDAFWGMPSFEVNQGCLILPEHLRVNVNGKYRRPLIVWPEHGLGSTESGPGPHVVGSDTIGTVKVNGGTLMFGADGNGDNNVQLYRGSELLNENFNKSIFANKGGSNILSSDEMMDKTNGAGKWITLTGLPADSHMKNILRTDNNDICGDFQNQDIWTNGDGVMKTKITENSHDIIFEDQEGNPYHYRYENGKVTKQEIPKFKDAPESNAPVRVEEKYVVQGGSVFMLDDTDRLTITKNIPGGIVVATDGDLTVSTKSGAKSGITIGGLAAATGKKLNLTIDGMGLISSGSISADTVKIANTTVEAQAISGDIIIQNGASVKTEEPIKGARNEEGIGVFQTVIPKWSDSLTMDGSEYTNVGTAHKDGKMYLYVPDDSQKITVDKTEYALEYVEGTQTVLMTEIFRGNGKIDLSQGSAVIMDETHYRHGDKVYVNENEKDYEVSGSTTGNTLTVKSDAQIVLKDLTADCTEGNVSPVSLEPGVTAKITLQGKNTLSCGSRPAIHVPEGAELTIKGTGVLNATAGGGAAAIGGETYEVNGKTFIEGGTLNLTADVAAVGAGFGAETSAGCIVVTGGSIYAGGPEGTFGTTPVNESGEALSRAVIKPTGAENVMVDGEEYHVNKANTDGKLYLYMVSGRHTVTAGGEDYLVEPIHIADAEHGSVTLKLQDDDGSATLSDKDMLVEGSLVQIRTETEKGYALFEGPKTGTYRAEEKGGKLVLVPDNVSMEVYDTIWQAEKKESFAREETPYTGNATAQIKGSHTMELGAAQKGNAVVKLQAMGKGLSVEVLVNGESMKSVKLTGKKQLIQYEFESDGTDVVSLRFAGTGTVTMSDLMMGGSVAADNVAAVFKRAYTVYIDEKYDPDKEDLDGYILLRDSDGGVYYDMDIFTSGYQVFEGDTVTAYYVDPDGGSIVDGYTLTYADGSTQTVNQTELPLTFGPGNIAQDVTLALQTHLEPYYEMIIPETVAVGDTESSAAIGAQNVKNMQPGDELNVLATGLDANGNATITRVGADNTLLVPVTDADKNPLAEGGIAAQFMNNNVTPIKGGTIYFGAPVGERKAGDYTGTITFTIAYKGAGN